MRPFYVSPAPRGLARPPPPAAAKVVGVKAYGGTSGSGQSPERNSDWRDRSEEFITATSAGRQADSTGGFRSEFLGSPTGGSASAATLSLSSFAAPARALAAAVAVPLANYTRRCLLDSLSSIVGKKLFLLDETLADALSLLVDSTTLQQQGVDRCFPLRSYPLHASAVSPASAAASLVLFFCRPHLSLLPLIAHHIHFIERTYAPTRPQQAAAAASSEENAAGHASAVHSSGVGGSKRSCTSVASGDYVDELRSTELRRASSTQKAQGGGMQKKTGTFLACRFPVPSSFSPSGRHYFVVCIPAASDFFTSEFRRLLASGTVPSPVCARAGEGAAAVADAATGAPAAGSVSGRQQQQEASALGATGVASSLFANLSNLPANLFGGSSSCSSQAGAAGAKVQTFPRIGASALCPPLSQGSATVTSCPLFFFPLAQDLLSLELPNSYRDLHLYGDRTPSQLAAAAILLLQEEVLHGALIPQLRSLGTAAKAVADQLIGHRKERQARDTEQQEQQQLSLYGPSAAGLFERPNGILSGAEGRGVGGHGLSYSAAAAAVRANRCQLVQTTRKYVGDADSLAAKAPHAAPTPATSRKRSVKRVDPPSFTETSVFQDPHNGLAFSVPLLPLAPPTRFVLSRDDLTLDEGEEEENSCLRNVGDAAASNSNGDDAKGSAAKKDRAEHQYAGDERLFSRDRSEDGCGSRGENCEYQALRNQPRIGTQSDLFKVDMLVLIDRRSDLITPLCTAFTYEALLDAIFGIEAAAVDVPQQLLLQQPQQQHPATQQQAVAHADGGTSGRSGSLLSFTPFFGGEKETETRSSKVIGVPVLLPVGPRRRISLVTDGLYTLLRDLHQSAVGARLHSIASGIQQTYKEKDALRSIQEISVFISKFKVKQKEHSSLSLHVRLASFLAAVTQDPAFVQRLALEDELLQSGVSSSSSAPPLKSSLVAQFESLLEDAAASERLWWAPGVAGVDVGNSVGGEGCMQQRLQQAHGSSPAAVAAGGGVGSEGNNRWRGTAAAGTGLVDFYRLLCLASLVNGGLRSKQIEHIRAGLLQHFGFEEMQRLALLHRVGLLRLTGGFGTTGSAAAGADKGGAASSAGGDARVQGMVGSASRSDADAGGGLAPGTWRILKRECNLLTDGTEGDHVMMDSISYACSGYAPLSVRLIELLFEHASGWRAIPHLLSLLWGPAMEVRQQPQPGAFATPSMESQSEAETAGTVAKKENATQGDGESLEEQETGGSGVAPEDIMTVLVFFLGGVTHAEVAAIRRLNELELLRYHQRKLQSCGCSSVQTEDTAAKLRRFVLLTTDVTNAKKLIESCKNPDPDTAQRFRWNPTICSEDST